MEVWFLVGELSPCTAATEPARYSLCSMREACTLQRKPSPAKKKKNGGGECWQRQAADGLLCSSVVGGVSEVHPLCVSPLILLGTDGIKEGKISMSEASGKRGRIRMQFSYSYAQDCKKERKKKTSVSILLPNFPTPTFFFFNSNRTLSRSSGHLE